MIVSQHTKDQVICCSLLNGVRLLIVSAVITWIVSAIYMCRHYYLCTAAAMIMKSVVGPSVVVASVVVASVVVASVVGASVVGVSVVVASVVVASVVVASVVVG